MVAPLDCVHVCRESYTFSPAVAAKPLQKEEADQYLSRFQSRSNEASRQHLGTTGIAFLLDKCVLVCDDPLRIRDHRLGLVDGALGCALVEGNEEALLHVDGVDAHDGGEKEEQVADQLHDRGRSGV